MSALRKREAEGERLVEGEYAFTGEDFRKIAALLHEQSGIHLPDSKAMLVYSRLAKRLRMLQLESFDQYCALVASADGVDERGAMLTALTTNVTKFFREPHHFDHFRDHLIAPMAAQIRTGVRTRFWSSACSTGQEAYSMAFTLLSKIPEAMRQDVKILATDIDVKVLATAEEGVYSAESSASIPGDMRERWMKRESTGAWRVRDEVRNVVAFRHLNLVADWPMRGKFAGIFCRNVVIYFDEPTQVRLWERFRGALAPGGRLYIGHSERIESANFVSDGLTIYRDAKEARS